MIMRRAMTGILPKEIQWRVRKAELTAGFYHRMAAFGRGLLDDCVIKSRDSIGKYIDISTLRKASCIVCSEPEHEYAVAVWSTLILSLWLQQASFDGHDKQAVRDA